MKHLIWEEELQYRGSPWWGTTTAILVGGMILSLGTEEQKRRFLPSITRGEMQWAVGMSEPNSGSDVASLQLRAVEEEDCYVLNGEKTWQSGAHYASWNIVYTRTDPGVPKHQGLSVFLVDLKSPGITMRRIVQMSGLAAFDEIFYDNVRVPKENLLGEKNKGWEVLQFAVYHEKGFGLMAIKSAKRDLEHLVQYCKETHVNGQPLGKNPLIRNRLAEMAVEIEVGYILCRRAYWMADKGMVAVAEAAQSRPFGGRVAQSLANLGMQILGLYGQLDEKSKWAKMRGRMKDYYLGSVAMTIEGGTNEASKNIVSKVGLGMPSR